MLVEGEHIGMASSTVVVGPTSLSVSIYEGPLVSGATVVVEVGSGSGALANIYR